jgi:biopolymer transport protein ExbD
MKMPFIDQEDAKFAMAPMIDIVFLLLVFFMCTSTLSAKAGKRMNLAMASKGVIPKERADRYVVNIMADGGLFSGDEPVELPALKDLVRDFRTRHPGAAVYLRADGQASYRQVRKVMAGMAEAGVDDFIFGVYTPGEEPRKQP